MKNNTAAIISEEANKLLELMGVEHKLQVSEEGDAFRVDIEADNEAGLLIGRKGETLASLQLILSIIVNKKCGEWKKIYVNVGDWRERQDEYLKGIAREAAQRAIDTGEAQNIYNLNAAQRRVIHMFVSEVDGVTTESVGEEPDRYLVVKPKK